MSSEPLDLDPRQIADDALAVRTPGDGTDPVRTLAEAYLEQVRLGDLRLERLVQTLAELTRLRAAEQRVRALVDQWRKDRSGYPPGEPQGRWSSVAVKLCEDELLAALDGGQP